MSKRIVTSYVIFRTRQGDIFTIALFRKPFSAMYQAGHN